MNIFKKVFLIPMFLLFLTSCQPALTIEDAYTKFKNNNYEVEFYDYTDVAFINKNFQETLRKENYNTYPKLVNVMTFEIINSSIHHWGTIYQFENNSDARFAGDYLRKTEYPDDSYEGLRIQGNLVIISNNFIIVNVILDLNL
jgi:hypothetical protein